MKFTPLLLTAAACVGLTGWLAPRRSFAQDVPPAVPPAVSSIPAAPADPLKIERRVFVPFEDLAATMQDQGQGVFLPYREFLDMWNRLLEKKEAEKVKPPADGLLASAVFTGKVEGEVAVVEAVLQVESFKEGWAVLPLGAQELNVAKAETGKATLRRGEHGMEALLPEKGKYELKLQTFSRLQRGTGRQSLALALPKTPVSKLDLTIPGTGWEFTTEPATAFTSVPAPDGQGTVVSVFFGDRDRMTLSWQKAGGETKLTPLLFADLQAKCDLAPGALHTTMEVNYSILRAGVSEFELAVPLPHEVLAVRGENIKEWNVTAPEGGTGTQILKVSLHAPARDRFALSLELEAAVAQLPASLQAPPVEARGVLRQSGNIEVRAAAELDTTVKDVTGLAQQAVAEAPQPAGAAAVKPLLGNWRFLKLPWTLTLAAKKAEPVVEVESFTDFQVMPDHLTFRADFAWTIKRAGIFETRLQLPAGWEGVEATGPDVEGSSEELTGEGAAARRTLTIRFKNRLEGRTTVQVSGRQVRAAAETEAAVPVFAPQGVARHDALVGVRVDETLEANTRDAGGLKQEDVRRLTNKAAAAPADPINSNKNAAAAWTIGFRYRGEAAPAILTFKTRKPQVSGEVLTLTEIKDQSVSHHWWIVWDVLYSGIDTFYLSVPKAIAGDLRVLTSTLKEVDKTWQPAAGADAAKESWKIVARDKVPGRFTVELSYETPLGALEPGKNVDVAIPEIALLDLFQETGQIAVVKSGSLEVLTPDKSPALEPADPKELAPQLQKPGVLLAWKWKRHPAAVTLPVSRNELVSVPQAIVTYASLTSVMSTDEAITTEVVYHVRNNTQQYFTVKLPAGARMLSDVTVAGKSQQPQRRADQDGILIRLPASQEQQGEFVVRFVYDVASTRQGKGLGESGTVAIPQPELTDAGILQSQLTLYLPSGFAWHDFDSAMQLKAEARGWAKQRRRLGWLVPALGPQLPEYGEKPWAAPPALTSNDRGPFDFQLPRDGQAFLLHRLDQPAPVAADYRSKRLEHSLEAVGVLAGLGLGFLLRRSSLGVKFGYALFGGVGALVLEGAMDTAAGGFLRYFFVGVVLAVGFWMARAVVKFFRSPEPAPAPVISGAEPVTAPAEAPAAANESTDPDQSSTPPQS